MSDNNSKIDLSELAPGAEPVPETPPGVVMYKDVRFYPLHGELVNDLINYLATRPINETGELHANIVTMTREMSERHNKEEEANK